MPIKLAGENKMNARARGIKDIMSFNCVLIQMTLNQCLAWLRLVLVSGRGSKLDALSLHSSPFPTVPPAHCILPSTEEAAHLLDSGTLSYHLIIRSLWCHRERRDSSSSWISGRSTFWVLKGWPFWPVIVPESSFLIGSLLASLPLGTADPEESGNDMEVKKCFELDNRF